MAEEATVASAATSMADEPPPPPPSPPPPMSAPAPPPRGLELLLPSVMADEHPGLTVSSFNIWGIPFASHAFLSRPGKLGDVTAAAVLASAADQERIVLCFQEAWSFKTGLAAPCVSVARCLERMMPWCCTARYKQTFNPRNVGSEVIRINGCCTLVATIFGLLTGLCFPCAALRDDLTKEQIVGTLTRWGLPHAVGTNGTSGTTNKYGTVLDSGLLIVTNVKPTASGFVPYESVGVEGAAHKGFLWVLLPPASSTGNGLEGGGDLVVTTHQHADQPNHPDPASIRVEQRAQLIREVARLRKLYRPRLLVICGDFNEDADARAAGGGLHADMSAKPLQLTRLTEFSRAGTCLKDDGSGAVEELDHIYAGLDDGAARLEFVSNPALRTPWSDHSLLWVNRIRVLSGQ